MNFFDLVLGGLILYGVVRGFMKGFFIEVASLLALILGIYGAIHFSYIAGGYLEQKVAWDEKYVQLASFAITFIIIVLAIGYAGKLLTKVADFAALGILNRLLGGIFGGLKIAIILGAVLVFFDRTQNTFGFADKDTIQNSVLYRPVVKLGAGVFAWVLQESGEGEITE